MEIRMKKFGFSLAVLMSVLAMAGCGDVSAPTSTTTGTTGTGTTGTTTTPTYTMTLTSDVTKVIAGGTASITATVLANGVPDLTLSPSVNFTSTCVAQGKATLTSPVTGAASIAVSTYTDKGCGATDTIVATATVGGQSISQTLSLTVEALSITLTAPATLVAGGTTPISVAIYSGGVPLTSQSVPVTFSSTCVSTSTASLTSPVYSNNGVATATYADKGCGIIDTIAVTATVGGLTKSATANMTVETLSMTLTAPTTLVAGENATITALVKSGSNPYTLAQVPVTFSSTCVSGNKASMVSSALTNQTTGSVSVTFTDKGCGITTDTIVATATVGGVSVSSQAPMLVEGFTLSLVPATNPLAGGASTGVTATVSNSNGVYTLQPAQVAFTSNCVAQGTASMTTPAYTSNGVALSTYTDKGCATTDTLQATATLGAATFTATAPLTVQQVAMTLTPAASTLKAGGTTAVTAAITSGGAPYTTPIVVNFTSNCVTGSKATMASSAFSDAVTGEATVDFVDSGCGPTIDAVTATAVVGGVVLTAGTNLTIDTFSMSLVPALTNLSAGGTTQVSATLYTDAAKTTTYSQPVPISFTSNCVAATPAKATMDSPVYTSSGIADSSYTDIGCASTDALTATATLGGKTITATSSLTVASASAGSISFVSANPTNIGIKGAGLIENSLVTFKVVSNTGVPLSGQLVSFTLDNTQGGITLSPTSATTATDGTVSTTVTSGTAATAVRVKATSGTLQTQSDSLVISTGISDQDSFSLSVSEYNPEANILDGTKVTVNVYAADAFNNPVPDGSAIYFTTEGGQIVSNCLTANGGCSVEWTSSNPRPILAHNGRITILATMLGEESFTDQNSNNRYDAGEPLVDVPEAWRDDDESGAYELGEVYRDFDTSGSYGTADGLYSGVLCNSGCATSKSVEVRDTIVLVMADSYFTVDFYDSSLTLLYPPIYDVTAGPTTGYARICGANNGGFPPNGTKVSLTVGNGKVTLLGGDTVPNVIPPGPSPIDQCYIQAFSVDKDTTPSTGTTSFKVTTPSNAVSAASIQIID